MSLIGFKVRGSGFTFHLSPVLRSPDPIGTDGGRLTFSLLVGNAFREFSAHGSEGRVARGEELGERLLPGCVEDAGTEVGLGLPGLGLGFDAVSAAAVQLEGLKAGISHGRHYAPPRPLLSTDRADCSDNAEFLRLGRLSMGWILAAREAAMAGLCECHRADPHDSSDGTRHPETECAVGAAWSIVAAPPVLSLENAQCTG